MKSVWRIATDTPDYTAEDMAGVGAKLAGGRWNRSGTPVTYSAESIALACLETFIYVKVGSLPLNRYLVRIDIPDEIWASAVHVPLPVSPVGWDSIPHGAVSLNLGTHWAQSNRSVALVVPSVIVPEERNIILNPGHSDARYLVATKVRKFI
jgi:RES domain-containing protein